MSEEVDLFGEVVKKKPKIDKDKRNWENRFQTWSNKQQSVSATHYGKCGYGSVCDYCDLGTIRPCVRALNEMLRSKKISLNYNAVSFEDLWDGNFELRKEDEGK